MLEHKEVIVKLESLVTKRFESLTGINSFLRGLFVVRCPVEEKTRYDDESQMDFNLIGNLKKDNIFCDFDIYYIKDNANRYYITEVGYEFE
jgi:hypothetical protein